MAAVDDSVIEPLLSTAHVLKDFSNKETQFMVQIVSESALFPYRRFVKVLCYFGSPAVSLSRFRSILWLFTMIICFLSFLIGVFATPFFNYGVDPETLETIPHSFDVLLFVLSLGWIFFFFLPLGTLWFLHRRRLSYAQDLVDEFVQQLGLTSLSQLLTHVSASPSSSSQEAAFEPKRVCRSRCMLVLVSTVLFTASVLVIVGVVSSGVITILTTIDLFDYQDNRLLPALIINLVESITLFTWYPASLLVCIFGLSGYAEKEVLSAVLAHHFNRLLQPTPRLRWQSGNNQTTEVLGHFLKEHAALSCLLQKYSSQRSLSLMLLASCGIAQCLLAVIFLLTIITKQLAAASESVPPTVGVIYLGFAFSSLYGTLISFCALHPGASLNYEYDYQIHRLLTVFGDIAPDELAGLLAVVRYLELNRLQTHLFMFPITYELLQKFLIPGITSTILSIIPLFFS